jgi:putative transcription factor
MQCEVCDKHIVEGKRVRIEGSVVVTCEACARYGEVVGSANSVEKKKPSAAAQEVSEKREVADFAVGGLEELVENYAEVIRNKRMRRGLKQEELAKLINEPTSLVHRLEIGRFEPSPDVARKLQHALGVKLLHKSEEVGLPAQKEKDSGEVTLGDMVVIKKKEKK